MNSDRLGEVATGKVLKKIQAEIWGLHTLGFSADGTKFFFADKYKSLQLHVTSTGQELCHLDNESYLSAAALSPDNRYALTNGKASSVIRLWQLPEQ
jgi:WD40 repeat protein